MARDTSAYVDAHGRRLPSVTEILALAGCTSIDRIPEHHLEAGRVRGTDLHAWLHGIDVGRLDRDDAPPESIAPRVDAYWRFLEETRAKVVASEFVVRHEALRYVGTADRLYEIPGQPGAVLVDLKATAALYPETRLQVAGYALACPRLPRRAALWLRADGTYRFQRYDGRGDLDDWIAVVRVAHIRLAEGWAVLP